MLLISERPEQFLWGFCDNIYIEGLLEVCSTCKLKYLYLMIVQNCTFSIFTALFCVQWLPFMFWGCTLLWRQEACLTWSFTSREELCHQIVSVSNIILHNNSNNFSIDSVAFIAIFLELYAASPVIMPLKYFVTCIGKLGKCGLWFCSNQDSG